MERRAIRESVARRPQVPDFAALHPGYELLLRMAAIYPILRKAETSGRSNDEGTGSMRPSISLENNRSQVREVLQRFGMTNPRVFGSAARGEDTDRSDLDIMVDAPPGTSLYDLAAIEVELETILGCKVEVLTRGFLASDVAERAEVDLLPIP
jgi:predicted nucleotidyltransferase